VADVWRTGVDAINTILEVVLFAAAMNLGQGWYTVLTLFGAAFTFYVQTWDEYYTQTLTLGIVSGPVEGVLTLCIVYAITAVKGGGSFWHQAMLPTIGMAKPAWLPDEVYALPFTKWYIIYGGVVLVFNTVQSVQHVFAQRATAAAHSKKSGINPLAGLGPALTMWVLSVAYLYLQPIILHQHLVPFCFYLGLVNAYSVGKTIIAHLVKSPRFPYTNSLIWPLAIGVADSLGPFLGLWPSVLGDDMYQVAFMFASLGLAVGVYGSFVVSGPAGG
jgi:ethanolaminephosphotransferase